MNGLLTSALVLHVVVAVLGLGSIASVAVIAGAARRTGGEATQVLPWLGPLLRVTVWSLAAMLVTGILMDLAAKGAFNKMWWFRGSALLLIATGALHGQARRAVRLGVLPRVERIAWGMCALIAAITILMEVKPF